MQDRPTVGALAVKAAQDTTKYDPLEIGHAVNEDFGKQLETCVELHDKIFNEDEYCVCFVLANDPLIHGVKRRKFYAYPHLPSPRPDQGVFLWSKRKQTLLKRLWILPPAPVMEALYLCPNVADQFKSMKRWSVAFYDGHFWETIRKEHGIKMLSEIEYLNAHREELIKAGCKEIQTLRPDPFDFSKIATYKVVDSDEASSDQ